MPLSRPRVAQSPTPRSTLPSPGPPACLALTFWVDGVDTAIPMPDPGRTDRTLY